MKLFFSTEENHIHKSGTILLQLIECYKEIYFFSLKISLDENKLKIWFSKEYDNKFANFNDS